MSSLGSRETKTKEIKMSPIEISSILGETLSHQHFTVVRTSKKQFNIENYGRHIWLPTQ